MKRRIALILFLWGMLSAACLWAAEPEVMDATASPEKIAVPAKPWTGTRLKGIGYTVQNLYDWQKESRHEAENQDGEGLLQILALVSATESEDDPFTENINVVVEKLPEGTTEQDYFRLAVPEIRKVLGPDAKIGPYTPVLIGKIKGWKNSFQWTTEDGLEVKQDSYVFLKDNMAYVVTCSATADSYDAYQSKFNAMVGTFRFAKQ